MKYTRGWQVKGLHKPHPRSQWSAEIGERLVLTAWLILDKPEDSEVRFDREARRSKLVNWPGTWTETWAGKHYIKLCQDALDRGQPVEVLLARGVRGDDDTISKLDEYTIEDHLYAVLIDSVDPSGAITGTFMTRKEYESSKQALL